jgi:hypothetical protein
VLLELCHECLVFRRSPLGVLEQEPGELAGCGQLWSRRWRSHRRVLAMRMDPLGPSLEKILPRQRGVEELDWALVCSAIHLLREGIPC